MILKSQQNIIELVTRPDDYKTHNPNFAYYKVEGGHHLHLNTPEKVAPLVTKFLLQDFTAEGDKIKEVPFDMI